MSKLLVCNKMLTIYETQQACNLGLRLWGARAATESTPGEDNQYVVKKLGCLAWPSKPNEVFFVLEETARSKHGHFPLLKVLHGNKVGWIIKLYFDDIEYKELENDPVEKS